MVLKGVPVKLAKKFASDIKLKSFKKQSSLIFLQFWAARFYFTCSEAAEVDLSGC